MRAVLLVVALSLGSPGCGCDEDSFLVGGVSGSCRCDANLAFDLGSPVPGPLPPNVVLVNLVLDPVTGCIGFGPSIATFPTVYMAASARGTVVRIDTNTGVILGEYATAPRGLLLDPSRTTVDKYGECWVGNRLNMPGLDPGSIMRVGVVEGGTRGNRLGPVGGPYTFVPNPSGQYVQGPFTYLSPSVTDRDGDGFIRTSAGLGDILPWDGAATGGDDLGGVTLAEDEGIVNFTRVAPSGVRGLAIDCNNDLWVGGHPTTTVRQFVSGTTGLAVSTRNVGPAYGEIIDRNSVLWSVDRAAPGSNGLFLHDIAANTTAFAPAPGVYGIAINPCDNNVWTSSLFFGSEGPPFSVSGYLLRRWNSSGVLTGAWAQPGPAQGLCIDQNGDLWVSSVWNSGAGVWQFDSSGTLLNTVPTGTIPFPATGTTGTAVDQNGKIWASDLAGNAARRIDPLGVPAVDLTVDMGPGSQPYNYSDMTGLVSLSSCGQTGFLIATHDSLCPGIEWGRVTWQSMVTGTNTSACTVTAEVRASNDPLNYPTTWTPIGNGFSFCGAPVVAGQYIQVRVTFTRPPGCPPECDPKLCSLRIECCEGSGVGRPPSVTIDDPIFVPNPGGPTAPVQVRGQVVDPDGGPLQASWSVDGVLVGPAVLDAAGQTSHTQDFPDGISEVALTASDGSNTVIARTTVMVGDQEAPAVTCPEGPPVQGGAIVVSAFDAPIPDLVSGSSATDNLTAPAMLVMSQAPPAGTVVTQGNHRVVVTATDAAGNDGTCSVFFTVTRVVSVLGIAQYGVFPGGTPIPVDAAYSVPTSDIAATTVFVDGAIHTAVVGALVTPVDLNLAAGSHEVEIVVTSTGGVESRSGPVLFGVS